MNKYKYKLEYYYKGYYYLNKYLLGFSNEGYKLALKLSKSSEKNCRSAALNYIDLNLNP